MPYIKIATDKVYSSTGKNISEPYNVYIFAHLVDNAIYKPYIPNAP